MPAVLGLPPQSVQTLMRRADVVAADKEGKFHVYPVRSIDEGVEILTGVEAGVAAADGSYDEGTVHGLVDLELQRLAKGWKTFAASDDKGEDRPEGSK